MRKCRLMKSAVLACFLAHVLLVETAESLDYRSATIGPLLRNFSDRFFNESSHGKLQYNLPEHFTYVPYSTVEQIRVWLFICDFV